MTECVASNEAYIGEKKNLDRIIFPSIDASFEEKDSFAVCRFVEPR